MREGGVPLTVQLTVRVVAAVQLSPPLGEVNVMVGDWPDALMVKLASLASCARMFALTSSARTRIRAWVELVPLGIVQLMEREVGVWVVPMLLYVLPPSVERATNW